MCASAQEALTDPAPDSSRSPLRGSCSSVCDVSEPIQGGRIVERSVGRLREHTDLPMLMVPELFTRATGRRVVSLVAEALAEELD